MLAQQLRCSHGVPVDCAQLHPLGAVGRQGTLGARWRTTGDILGAKEPGDLPVLVSNFEKQKWVTFFQNIYFHWWVLF